MLPVHLAGAAARHRPPAGRSSEGKGSGGRPGGPAITPAASFAATQQLAMPHDGGQGRAVRGGGRGEEGQRRGVHRGQLLLPDHRRIHRCQGIRTVERRGMVLFEAVCHLNMLEVSHTRCYMFTCLMFNMCQ